MYWQRQRVDNTKEGLGQGKTLKNGAMSLVAWDRMCSIIESTFLLLSMEIEIVANS